MILSISMRDRAKQSLLTYRSVPTTSRLTSSGSVATPKGFPIVFYKPQYGSCVFSTSLMHLKPATSTYTQPHNEQDMGFSMLSESGQRTFPVSNYADWHIPVKNLT